MATPEPFMVLHNAVVQIFKKFHDLWGEKQEWQFAKKTNLSIPTILLGNNWTDGKDVFVFLLINNKTLPFPFPNSIFHSAAVKTTRKICLR